jgi:hypothetical protein
MGKVQERIAAALAAELGSRAGWDEPPGLYWLTVERGEPSLAPAPIPWDAWSLGPPAGVLSAIADGCRGSAGALHSFAPDGLHGAAFFTETWMVIRPSDAAAEIAEAKADARAHRIHQRPDRVEARSMWAVDRAGNVYVAMLRRGIDDVPVTKVEYAGPGRTIRGDIPAALERIVSAVLAVTMPGCR